MSPAAPANPAAATDPRACPCGTPLGAKNRSGQCRRCVVARINRDPATREKQRAAIRAHFARPEVRAAQSARMKAVIAKLTPEQIERRREHGRRQVANCLSRPDVVARTMAPEVRARAGRARTETALRWCPPEWRDKYRELTRKGRRAAVARAMVLAMIEGREIVPFAHQKAQLAWCPESRRKQYHRLRRRHGAPAARRMVEAEMRAVRLAGYSAEAAADFLRRLGPVYRCDAAGAAHPRGDRWRRGAAILCPAELVERALQLGWEPEAWRRVAA